MKKRSRLEQLGDFVLGKGFYIVLLLCVATVGVGPRPEQGELSAAKKFSKGGIVRPVGGQTFTTEVVFP